MHVRQAATSLNLSVIVEPEELCGLCDTFVQCQEPFLLPVTRNPSSSQILHPPIITGLQDSCHDNGLRLHLIHNASIPDISRRNANTQPMSACFASGNQVPNSTSSPLSTNIPSAPSVSYRAPVRLAKRQGLCIGTDVNLLNHLSEICELDFSHSIVKTELSIKVLSISISFASFSRLIIAPLLSFFLSSFSFPNVKVKSRQWPLEATSSWVQNGQSRSSVPWAPRLIRGRGR